MADFAFFYLIAIGYEVSQLQIYKRLDHNIFIYKIFFSYSEL